VAAHGRQAAPVRSVRLVAIRQSARSSCSSSPSSSCSPSPRLRPSRSSKYQNRRRLRFLPSPSPTCRCFAPPTAPYKHHPRRRRRRPRSGSPSPIAIAICRCRSLPLSHSPRSVGPSSITLRLVAALSAASIASFQSDCNLCLWRCRRFLPCLHRAFRFPHLGSCFSVLGRRSFWPFRYFLFPFRCGYPGSSLALAVRFPFPASTRRFVTPSSANPPPAKSPQSHVGLVMFVQPSAPATIYT
jgi:hypothetical protein